MTVIFWTWLLVVAIGTIFWGWHTALVASQSERTALNRSVLATTPVIMPVAEWGFRSLLHSPGLYVLRWPFLAACLVGGLSLLGSFLDAPPGALSWRANVIRTTHLLAWAAGLLVSLTMILDM